MRAAPRALWALAVVVLLGPAAGSAATGPKAKAKKAKKAKATKPVRSSPVSTFVPPPAFPSLKGDGLDKSGAPFVGESFVFRWPLDRVLLTSRFGKRKKGRRKGRFHRGTDMDGDPGEPVLATGPGRVVHSGWFFGYGNLVVVDHHGGFQSRYGHLAEVHVFNGQIVRSGASLGLVGSTGRSTGTHLHFGIYYKGRPIDPETLVGTPSDGYLDIPGSEEPMGPSGLEPM